MSIIDLTFTTLELRILDPWVIEKELATPSDHERIVFDMANLYETVSSMGRSQEVTGWAIKAMSGKETEEAEKAWQECTAGEETLGDRFNTEKVEEEAT